MKKIILLGQVLATGILVSCLLPRAFAQSSCSTAYYNMWKALNATGKFCGHMYAWNSFPMSDEPKDMVCCGAFTSLYCIAPAPGCLPPNTCISCLLAGQPINLETGNTFIKQTDISVPGLGGGLQLTRTWNSLPQAVVGSLPSMFGRNWRSTYEEQVFVDGADNNLKYVQYNGTVEIYALSTLGTQNAYGVLSPANDPATLTDGQIWTMTLANGEKRLFDIKSGLLTSIIDRNGNTTQLSYDSSNRLTTVTDAASRHLYFSYVSTTSPLVSQVTSDIGITLSYQYDSNGRLTQVTKPDNTTVGFQYNDNSDLTAVLDTNGKVLETHTYNAFHMGLTSSLANGVQGVTITYPHGMTTLTTQ